jgi:hypothetical protein
VTKARTAADFKTAHDPATIINALKAELAQARKDLVDADAVKIVLGTLASEVDRVAVPDWTLAKPKTASGPGIPTLFLSDLHWAERVDSAQINGVNEYDLSIARKRLRHTVQNAIHLCRILDSQWRYPGIVVPLGGDMISGNIHEELTATNEINSMPAILDLYGELVAAITILANAFGNVFLPCVSGNHGRDTRKIWSKDRHATSFDWLLYMFLAKHFANAPRVRFLIPTGPDAGYRVYGHRYLLTHGDRLGHGGDGLIGFLGPVTRGDHKRRSRNAQINLPYDTLLCGHWHSYAHLSRLIVNGTTKGYDEYAFTEAFPFEHPKQALWITHYLYRMTFRMPVLCDPVKGGEKLPEWSDSVGAT